MRIVRVEIVNAKIKDELRAMGIAAAVALVITAAPLLVLRLMGYI